MLFFLNIDIYIYIYIYIYIVLTGHSLGCICLHYQVCPEISLDVAAAIAFGLACYTIQPFGTKSPISYTLLRINNTQGLSSLSLLGVHGEIPLIHTSLYTLSNRLLVLSVARNVATQLVVSS